eukprot:Blabericola_migrator_1__1990@NODE_1543_length_4312_cov_312_694464_g1013_i0_p1_GENE_NODE_1543_length_4312_cov_312_694464_g1013_i0NODE_1543_length_4312_cov_312_694464_g1013_i0_p1_ORF_typecomplete_len1116_score190_212OGFeII_Oxy_3/PF13640_6/9e09Exonuc_XT_C/PF08411_10/0_31Exonuc_XT_C/PF08411_10/3_9e02_NODE_1543_length_4312_cov_312_694464_g1013_i02763350
MSPSAGNGRIYQSQPFYTAPPSPHQAPLPNSVTRFKTGNWVPELSTKAVEESFKTPTHLNVPRGVRSDASKAQDAAEVSHQRSGQLFSFNAQSRVMDPSPTFSGHQRIPAVMTMIGEPTNLGHTMFGPSSQGTVATTSEARLHPMDVPIVKPPAVNTNVLYGSPPDTSTTKSTRPPVAPPRIALAALTSSRAVRPKAQDSPAVSSGRRMMKAPPGNSPILTGNSPILTAVHSRFPDPPPLSDSEAASREVAAVRRIVTKPSSISKKRYTVEPDSDASSVQAIRHHQAEVLKPPVPRAGRSTGHKKSKAVKKKRHEALSPHERKSESRKPSKLPQEENPVLVQIQSAVTELASICKTLTETSAQQRSHRVVPQTIEPSPEPSSKETQDTVIKSTSEELGDEDYDDGERPLPIKTTDKKKSFLSPRTINELTETVSKNVTSQLLDSILSRLGSTPPSNKVSRPAIHTMDDADDDDVFDDSSDEFAVRGRHRAFSWSDTLSPTSRRRWKRLLKARNEQDKASSRNKGRMTASAHPESHTVSSISPHNGLPMYGRRPEVHTYGGTQFMLPPWMFAMNPYLAASPTSLPPTIDPMQAAAFGFFNPFAQMLAATQSAGSPFMMNPNTTPASPLDATKTSTPLPPSPRSAVPSGGTASSPFVTQQEKPQEEERHPEPPTRPSTESRRPPVKQYVSSPVSQRAQSIPSGRTVTRSPLKSSASQLQFGQQHRKSPSNRPELYEGAQIESLTPHVRPKSGSVGATIPIRPPGGSSGRGMMGLPRPETTPPMKELPLNQGPETRRLPQQEVLYTLRIDTFHGDNNERTENWAKTRQVDAIQVYKDPEMLVLPNLVTPDEIEYMLKNAADCWTDYPPPGVIVDQVTRTDSYGRIMTSSQQPSQPRPIYVAEIGSNQCPCVGRVQRRLAASAQLSISDVESVQLLRYTPGAYLPPHVDGRRRKTAVIFLNDLDGGPAGAGAIAFLKLGLQVQPQRGTALLWTNMKDDSKQIDIRSIHCDRPHPSREKLILVCWFRDS